MIEQPRHIRRIMLAVVLTAAAVVGHQSWPGNETRTATAYFTSTVGIYEGDSVTILGVDVGEITDITPEPGRVRVRFTYDRPVPADVKAVITTPSLVPVRQLALTPAYDGGETLDDGDEIPLGRTAVPVEWDQVKEQLTDLSTALGPRGANKDGSLSRALSVSAANLGGNGPAIKRTISEMSEAMTTLADNGGTLFATVRNLSVFVQALYGADALVVDFNRRLADVSSLLGADAEELEQALADGRAAMADMRLFLRNNGDAVTKTVRDARPMMSMLAERRQDIASILHVAPTAMSNLYNLGDPLNHSLTASVVLDNVNNPATMLCTLMQGVGTVSRDCHDALTPLARLAGLSTPALGLNPIQRNSRRNLADPRTGEPVTPRSSEPTLTTLLVPEVP